MSTATPDLRSPYPWFGGKSTVAELVWSRFGEVRNYVEPFFGSGAMLLCRPQPFEGTETVNDLNAWLANFWRALQRDPEAVADHADYPVSELDLHARGDWLFYRPGVAEFIEAVRSDPNYYDAKSAGWWVWGQCCWIGAGWGPRKLPHLGDAGRGVNRKRPHLGDAGRGVNRQRPHLGDAGQGVNRKLPHLGNAGQGVKRQRQALHEYLTGLADRMRSVRVCCGDWSRVCGPTPTVKQGLTAVFLDPPYAVEDRADVYDGQEDKTIAHAVRQWCLDAMQWPDAHKLRIALCGYEGEHEMPSDWECVAWKAKGGYASYNKAGNDNCRRERVWFSPHCLRPQTHKQRSLL